MAYTLFTRHLRFDPADPAWPDRDRFVLSAGHGQHAALRMLHLTGYDLTLDDLQAPSGSGAARRPAIPSTATRPASRPPPGRWARVSPTPSAWPSPSAFWPPRFNGAGHAIVDHYTYVLAGDG